jgi:biotin synthase
MRPNHEGPSVTDSAIEATSAERSLSLTDILAEAERRLLVERACLTPAEVLALQALSDQRLGDLADLAHRVRVEYCGDAVDVESIISAKTGGCPEDCAFCSQSSRFPTEVAPTGYLSHKELLRAAEETQQRGATEFCIVMALRGPDQRTMDYVAGAVELLRRETDLNVACSLGLLTRQQAVELASFGVHRYNHNLESCRSFLPKICTTHTWEERRETCKLVKEVGMQLCTGGIIGMGETPEQRVEFAFELAELDPHEVPVNFLNPRPGTPLGDRPILDGAEAIRTIALFRLIMPSTVMRYAGGREITLGELQAMGLKAGINALITGNYLTTLGQTVDQDFAMLRDLKMPVRAVSDTL